MSPRTRLCIVAACGLLVIATVLTSLYYFVSYTEGMDLYRCAYRELVAGHYDAAIILFDAAEHKKLGTTTLALVYGNRGWAYTNKGLDDRAIRDFSESIRLDSRPVYAVLDRGLAYHRKGEFEKAMSDYNTALSKDPNLSDAYHNRGLIFANRGDWAKAIADFSEAIRCDPANAQFFVDRGMAFAANNELDPAIANFDAAIGLNPVHAGAYIQRAGAYSLKGNVPKGLADVTEAIRHRPEARQLWYARALIYLDRGAIDEAIADCDEALRTTPDYDLGYEARARAEAQLRDWDKVLSDTAAALALYPKLPTAHFLRGRAFTFRGDFDQAIEEFNAALRLDSSFQWAVIRRAENYGYRREYSRAQQEFRRALANFPHSEAPHLGLAWFLATCPHDAYRNGAEAIAEAMKGCEISHWTTWYAVDTLAAAYAEYGDFDAAIRYVTLALRMPGASPKERLFMEERLSLYQHRIAVRDVGASGGSRNVIEEGMRAYARQDYDRAIQCFNAVLPPNPGGSVSAALFHFFDGTHDEKSRVPWAVSAGQPLSNAFYYRGLSYERKREWNNAIADFTAAVHREPESTLALAERGISYAHKSETDRALRDFDEIIRLKPNDALAYALRADTLQLTKQWDAAVEAATIAIRLEPKLADAHYALGRAYTGKEEQVKAAREFSEADRLDPDYIQTVLASGYAFNAKGNYKLAQAEFRETTERFPRSALAHNQLAWFLATCPDAAYRNGAEAVAQAKSACEFAEWKEPMYLDTLAAAFAEAGDFDQAVKYMKMTISHIESHPEYRKEIEEHLALFQRKEAYRTRRRR